MRKSFMNIKNFVDSNVRHRIDKTANSSDPITDDLVIVERQFEDLRQLCVEAEKRISTMLQSIDSSTLGAYTQNVQASLSNLSQLTVTSPVQSSLVDQQNLIKNYANSPGLNTVRIDSTSNSCNQLQADGGQSAGSAEFDIKKHQRKLPIVGFLKFLAKSCHKLRQDSLLATTLTHCSHLQAQLTKLYMSHERTIEAQCLKPIQQVLETDVPNVIRLRKSFIKAHNDLESLKARYNGASQKQQQHQLTAHYTSASYTITQSSTLQSNINKLDLLKKELDDAETRFEQAKDTYAIELYTFVCHETELVKLFMKFYQLQASYQTQASKLINSSLPSLSDNLVKIPRRVVFGTPLTEHLRCTSRSVSVLVELCVHLLYSNALSEEGLFRIPGSSIKIKKLKSAINAWFVTLATHNEPSDNQDDELHQRQRKSTAIQQPTLFAIYNLFKDIVGQRPLHRHASPALGEVDLNNQIVPDRDGFARTYADPSAVDRNSNKLVFDVHTVAGLLKLYLRELPEPLLGDALYDQWVGACAKSSDTGKPEALVGLKQVVQQLPKANFDNLRLLIRFLHLLTCHHEENKMTATNLAITMAPSLIWAPKNRQHKLDSEPDLDSHQQMDEVQMLNMQMSSMGISASLHALIIENLIKHAEQLFPGEIDFALYNIDFDPVSEITYGGNNCTSTKYRHVKSTSPTGSSTESTSSFSSNSNISSSKKSGSIDVLAPSCDSSSLAPVRPTRPLSVQVNQLELEKKFTKPPVPPAPAIRTHARQSSDSHPSLRLTNRKPPAPPVPGQSVLRELPKTPHQSHIYLSENNGHKSRSTYVEEPDLSGHSKTLSSAGNGIRPTSLRGSGTAITTESPGSSCAVSPRPSVPPPDRPHNLVRSEQIKLDQPNLRSSVKFATLTSGNVKDFKGSDEFRADFEEISALDMIDDVDISDQTSPVVSLDSISGDDSSFDNHSLDHSWTEGDSDKDQHQQTDSSSEEAILASKLRGKSSARGAKSKKKHDSTKDDTHIQSLPETKAARNPVRLAPSKPPRNSSPKTSAPSVTQSTLL